MCIIARLLFLHSSSLSSLHHSPVQTESCNYTDCHLIAAPLSAASPRTSPFYIRQIQRERERDVMIAFWAGISLNFTMFLIRPIISSQCLAFSIRFSFFCRSRCDVWHKTESHSVSFEQSLHSACFIWCHSSVLWRVLWWYLPLFPKPSDLPHCVPSI